MKFFVKITTEFGTLIFPFGSKRGYRSRYEAECAASEAMKHVPDIISAEVQEVEE